MVLMDTPFAGRQIGVAILGSGFMARTHATAWAAHADRATVRVVASRRVEGAAAVAEPLGAEATDDLAAAIARPDVDIVDICLPTPLHRPWTEAAFAAGRHVLLEKPIALNVEDAEAILAARDASGKILLVGFVLRFWPEYEVLVEQATSGALGRPLAMSTLRLSKAPDWNEWMSDPSLSGGATVDLLVHDFDQVAEILGTPRTVAARAVRAGAHANPQHVVAVVGCERGEAVVEGSLLMPASYPFTSGIRVLCEHGALEYPFSVASPEEGGNISGIDQETTALRLYPSDGAPRRLDAEAGDPWQRQCAYLLDRVASGTAPDRATGEQALVALRLALAANRSIASGRTEDV
jgi:UDP-N-acetylglucosamine 3-dehydrogenase